MNEKPNKRGRPTKAENEKTKRVNVSMPIDVLEWLKAQPNGVSAAIAGLVRIAKGDAQK